MADAVLSTCRLCGYSGSAFHPSRLDRCKRCLADRQRAYRRTRPKDYWTNKDRRYALKKRYGLTLERFDSMVREQEGRCAGCGQPSPLYVDHDHATSTVRGLLCNGCNRALGFVSDNPATLRALAAYLEQRAAS